MAALGQSMLLCAWREMTGSNPSAQRLFQQRKTVGIETERRLQHRCFHGACCGVDAGFVGNVAMRGGSAPALEHGTDEMHILAVGYRRHLANRGFTDLALL